MITARARKGVLGLGLLLIGISVVSAGSGEAWAKVRAIKYTCQHPADFDKNGSVDGADNGLLLVNWGGDVSGDDSKFDLTGDGQIDGQDVGVLLAAWGTPQGCRADLNNDCSVDGADLGLVNSQFPRSDFNNDKKSDSQDAALLLMAYGPCPRIVKEAVPAAVLDATMSRISHEAQ